MKIWQRKISRDMKNKKKILNRQANSLLALAQTLGKVKKKSKKKNSFRRSIKNNLKNKPKNEDFFYL